MESIKQTVRYDEDAQEKEIEAMPSEEVYSPPPMAMAGRRRSSAFSTGSSDDGDYIVTNLKTRSATSSQSSVENNPLYALKLK
jgi:hypothetical protein